MFRDAADGILRFVNYPTHTGTREFAPDFPSPLKVRAPAGAVKAEVNLLLNGPGTAWFDEVFFGPTQTGSLSGTVTSGGAPLEGARVRIWGDPWGQACETLTDGDGLPGDPRGLGFHGARPLAGDAPLGRHVRGLPDGQGRGRGGPGRAGRHRDSAFPPEPFPRRRKASSSGSTSSSTWGPS